MNNSTTWNKTHALFLDKASLYPLDLDFSMLEELAVWQWLDNAEGKQSYGDAEVVVTNKVNITRYDIENNSRLKLICIAATGTNNVDIEAAREHGVQVCNVRGYATPSVVQHVFTLMLALNSKLFSYKQSTSNNRWSQSDFFCYLGEPIGELQGKTLGIIGYGELGRAVAKMARCFGMNVLIARSHDVAVASDEARVDLKVLLSQSDVVTLHCPLTDNNRHMISEAELLLMKPDAILINTARGGLVDEMALLQALEKNRIGAAALDVLEQEPPPAEHALINYPADNLIITPHIAWASRESRQRLVNEIAENIRLFQQGDLRNSVC